MAHPRIGAGRDEPRHELRLGVVREIPVADLVVGNGLLVQIERVERRPGASDVRFEEIYAGSGLREAKRFVGRRLLDAGFETQRRREHEPSEAHVGDVVALRMMDHEQHVAARAQRFGRRIPANPGRERREAKTDSAKHVGEKQVLFEAPSAPASMDELLLERRDVERKVFSQERAEVLERDRGRMQLVNAREGGERRVRAPSESDAREVGVEVEAGPLHQSPSSG